MTFSSVYFSQLMKTFKCTIKRSRPRHPQSNGRVERVNRTIQDILYATDQANIPFHKALHLTQDEYK